MEEGPTARTDPAQPGTHRAPLLWSRKEVHPAQTSHHPKLLWAKPPIMMGSQGLRVLLTHTSQAQLSPRAGARCPAGKTIRPTRDAGRTDVTGQAAWKTLSCRALLLFLLLPRLTVGPWAERLQAGNINLPDTQPLMSTQENATASPTCAINHL